MIPIIGVMIGVYVLTRMIELLANKETQTVVAIFAVITILAVLFGMFSLFGISSSIPTSVQ